MDEDREILLRFKAGETGAFSELVQKYRKPVLNIIYRLLGTADDAEDLAQEVFLRAYKGLPGFKEEAKFFTWLYRIAVNLGLRHRQRKNKFIFQSIEEKEESGSGEIRAALMDIKDPQRNVERMELQDRVRQAVLELPEEQQAVVILYRYQSLSYDEIAEVLNLTVSAVKSRLHRAKIALKEKLEPYVKS